MTPRFHFTFEPDWRSAPLAFWVHKPRPDSKTEFDPPAPPPVPHRGFAFLRVEFGVHELVFSAPEQVQHFISVPETKPLPTTRTLASRRGLPVGPNGHWLSRLPAELKSPRTRIVLTQHMRKVLAMATGQSAFDHKYVPSTLLWPGYTASKRTHAA
jgi:hypothetical protein